MKIIKFVGVLMLLLACTHALVAKPKGPQVEPEYTKGENPEGENSTPWALGSTGAFGNIWHGDQRMIQIHSVGSGSPVDGKLKHLDVILGVEFPKVDAMAEVKCSRTDCGVSGDCGHFKSEALSYYGSAVKPHIEEMRTREYEPYIKSRDPGQIKACKESWQKILDNSKNEVVLKSIKPYLDASDVKEREKVFPSTKN